MTTRQDVLTEARTWIGTRWKHQGRMKGVGTDCIGFVGGVALNLGIPGSKEWADCPEAMGYGRTPVAQTLLELSDRFLDRIPLHTIEVADILVMAFSVSKYPQHFAIVSKLNPLYIIHAYAQQRQVKETQAKLKNAKIIRAYRYKDIDD